MRNGTNSELVQDLQQRLQEKAGTETKRWWEKYMRQVIPFRGVNLVVIRQELQTWHAWHQLERRSQDDQLALALAFFEESYAEDKLAGVLYLQEYIDKTKEWSRIASEIAALFDRGLIFDWNVCDWLCIRVLAVLIEENGAPAAGKVSTWHTAPNLWRARASVVPFVYQTTRSDFQSLWLASCKVLIRREERFAKTGVGWIMREWSKSNPDRVRIFLKEHRQWLTREVLNNAVKYFDSEEQKRLRALLKKP